MARKSIPLFSAALTALLMILGLALAAAAQPAPANGPARGPGSAGCTGVGPGFPGGGDGDRDGCLGPERLWQRIELKPEQRQALDKLRDEGRGACLPLRKEMMRLRHELRGELLKDAPDGQAVARLAGEIGALQGKLMASRLRARLEMRRVLTPEQRDRLLLLEAERGHGRDGRHGHGAARGRGGRHHGGPGRDMGRGQGPWRDGPADADGI